MKREIYQTITFLNGDKCDILIPSIADISRAVQRQANQKCDEKDKLDVVVFIMEQVVLFNGKNKTADEISKMSGEIYFRLSPVLTDLINSFVL